MERRDGEGHAKGRVGMGSEEKHFVFWQIHFPCGFAGLKG
jgi:hypothetical protein